MIKAGFAFRIKEEISVLVLTENFVSTFFFGDYPSQRNNRDYPWTLACCVTRKYIFFLEILNYLLLLALILPINIKLVSIGIVYSSLAASKNVEKLTHYHALQLQVAFYYVLRTKAPGRLAAVTQSIQILFQQSCLRPIHFSLFGESLSLLIPLFGKGLSPLVPLF